MLFGAYRFHCRFENKALLPSYKGSTLRGVFGRALKTVTCTQGGRECKGCALRPCCLYTQVFETELADGEPHPKKFIRSAPSVCNRTTPFAADRVPGRGIASNLTCCCSDRQTAILRISSLLSKKWARSASAGRPTGDAENMSWSRLLVGRALSTTKRISLLYRTRLQKTLPGIRHLKAPRQYRNCRSTCTLRLESSSRINTMQSCPFMF